MAEPWQGHIAHYQPHTRYGTYKIVVYGQEAEPGALPLFYGTYETPKEHADAMAAIRSDRR